jgi:integrase
MPRARSAENIGLPPRWKFTHNAYYYQVPPGLEKHWDGKKKFRLGATMQEAYKSWGGRIKSPDQIRNVSELLDRYLIETVPEKKVLTQEENKRSIAKLRAVFGALPITGIRPTMIYQYVDKSKSKSQARKDSRTFSHVYTKAVEWGLLDMHPLKGQVRLKGEKPRDRYVEDWELLECLKLDCKRKKGSVLMVQAYLRLKLLTGLRRGDLLRLSMSDIKEDGLHVAPRKTETTTGKKLIFVWSEQLKETTQAAKDARPVDLSPWLFCNRKGECYFDEENGKAWGWDSIWQRFMDRVLKETKVSERFHEHDIRAKAGSDSETLEDAQKLLAHSDSKITNRVYRRKPEKVKPLR